MRLLLLACSLCLIAWRVNGDCDKRFTNGCSNYGMLKRFEGIFTSSCDRHDVCYDCGAKFRYTRQGCDETFHRNLLTACRSSFPSGSRNRKKCKKHANLYKAGVRAFGWLFFKKARKTKSFCNQKWVPGCLKAQVTQLHDLTTTMPVPTTRI